MTQVKSVMGPRARMARAALGMKERPVDSFTRLPQRVDLTREQNLTARHIARRNGSLADIAKAIGWTRTDETLRKKLRQLGIRPGSFKHRNVETLR